MRKLRSGTTADGFSLVEVMVAVVVICVGLLGIAKMQALALSNTNTSRLRALAAVEAASLASAMHSNREYWAGNTPPTTITVNAAANPQIQSSDATLQGIAGADLAEGSGNPSNITTPCIGAPGANPACGPNAPGPGADPAGDPGLNLAAFDIARWTASLNALLPNPQATVSCVSVAGNTAPVSCTIEIKWFERAVAMTQQEAQQEALNPGAANIEQPVYFLYVEP